MTDLRSGIGFTAPLGAPVASQFVRNATASPGTTDAVGSHHPCIGFERSLLYRFERVEFLRERLWRRIVRVHEQHARRGRERRLRPIESRKIVKGLARH